MSTENTRDHFFDVIRGFDSGMLVTMGDGKPHSRPMEIAAVENDEIVFITSAGSPKTGELATDGRATVVMQGKTQFASAWGTARVDDDRPRIARLWKSSWKTWFPKGKDDPDLRLVVLEPEGGEYWDSSGAKGVKYAFEAAKALARGQRLRVDEGDQHGKITM